MVQPLDIRLQTLDSSIKCYEDWPSSEDEHVCVGSDVFTTVTESLAFIDRRFGETFVHLYQTTWFHNPEYCILQDDNVKDDIF